MIIDHWFVIYGEGKVKSAYEPSGPSGQSRTDESSKSISTLPVLNSLVTIYYYTPERRKTLWEWSAQDFNTMPLVSTRNWTTSHCLSRILHTSRLSFAGVRNSVEANNATAQQNKQVTSCRQGLLWLLLIPSLPVKQQHHNQEYNPGHSTHGTDEPWLAYEQLYIVPSASWGFTCFHYTDFAIRAAAPWWGTYSSKHNTSC